MSTSPPTLPHSLRRRVDDLNAREQKVLSQAKGQARRRHKQALNLDTIDTLYPPSVRPWFQDARQERLEQMEYLYYVCHPNIMTLQAFVEILKASDEVP